MAVAGRNAIAQTFLIGAYPRWSLVIIAANVVALWALQEEITMVVRKTQHDTQPDKKPAASPGRFGLLLIVLTVTYLLSAFATGRWVDVLRVILFAGAALLALRNSVVPPRTARLILIAVLAGSAVMFAVALTTQTGNGIAGLWAGLVLLFAVVLIVHRVLSFGTVTIQSIYGALSAYLVIGLMFAGFFAALDYLAALSYWDFDGCLEFSGAVCGLG